MSEQYTKARFWKCALQVNDFNYMKKYCGTDHGMDEEYYNSGLVRIAKENNIKVIGLADHGNVDCVDAIRTLMNANDIVVFPGFEIASTEKAHFVCLFPENTSKDQLNRYLGALGLTNLDDDVWPSNLGGNDLLAKVEELGGFVYAAHCTDDNGVLRQKLVHVWQNPLLKAAQIPDTLDGLNDREGGDGYRRILLNKNSQYERETKVAIINAKDVKKPEMLAKPQASCLIKMTKPCFDSFKLAFQDAESGVKLNSEVSETNYSCIESLKITGGYLDGLQVGFSEHLNAVIGGRGTGKSTLLECIRFCLQRQPIGKHAQKQHDDIIKENFGRAKARVELVVRSSCMNGRRFTIAKRYGENASVRDENGTISRFTPADLLPDIEIYGQNEIYDIAQDPASQTQLFSRFLATTEHEDVAARIQAIIAKLAENRKKLLVAQGQVAAIEDEVARLPKLEEQLGQFKALALEEKLQIVPLLETEKRLQQRAVAEEGQQLDRAFQSVQDCLPDTVFLSDAAIAHLPHAASFKKLRIALASLRTDAEDLLDQWQAKYVAAQAEIALASEELQGLLQQEELALEKTFKELPACEGKSGKEIGIQFQGLSREIERIRPKQVQIQNHRDMLDELKRQRQAMLNELSALRAEHSAQFVRILKGLNTRLKGKLRLTGKPESNRQPVIQFLVSCKLENVAEGRLAWIKEAEDFSTVKLAEYIRRGSGAIQAAVFEEGWSVTPTIANALARLSTEQILQLEELELPDGVSIELNIAHEGQENFKPLDNLSTGQQCTAILHLLLLKNHDPLLMDQPEDNLDNAFIADRIVTELRSEKMARQFIFATHNANIPVFGNAEWIGVFEVEDGQATMPPERQGGIDKPLIREKAANILEGGRTAFNQRKLKYHY